MNQEKHIAEDLSAYLAGEVDSAQHNRIELHLRACETCRVELEKQTQLDTLLSSAQPIPPEPSLIRGVMERVQNQPARIPFKKRSILPWLAAAAVIAVILFLLRIQKDTSGPGDTVQKKPPVVQPKQESLPRPPDNIKKPESVIEKEEKEPIHASNPPAKEEPLKPEPSVIEPENVASITPEEAEVIAQLEELENMELISNYEDLENLEFALIGEGGESRH